MAINALVFAGTQTKWGISQEATFGTPIADAGTFEQFEGPVPTGIDYGVTRVIDPKANGMRVRSDLEKYYSDSGQLRVIPFSDMVVRVEDLGSLLYAVTQNVSEGVGTPFTKTYTITSTTTQPNFAANAGYFCSLAIYDPIASNMRVFNSCILRTLTLTADFAGDGRIMASGEWISGFANDVTADLSGTWAYNTQSYFQGNELSAKQVENTDQVIYGWSTTITNNAVFTSPSATGYAETYSLPFYDVTGEITTKYDAASSDFISASVVGTAKEIDLQVGTGGATGHFGMLYDGVVFDNASKDYGDPRGQAVTVPFTAINKNGGNTAVFTVSDAKDQTW